jgi:hypothetical protein
VSFFGDEWLSPTSSTGNFNRAPGGARSGLLRGPFPEYFASLKLRSSGALVSLWNETGESMKLGWKIRGIISGDVLVTEPALLSACNETKWPAGNALFPIVAITSTYYLQLQGPHALLGGAECGVFRLCPHSSKLSGCGCGWLMDWHRRGLSVQPLLLY